MPKYISREALPQFKYYSYCDDEYNYWFINEIINGKKVSAASYQPDEMKDALASYVQEDTDPHQICEQAFEDYTRICELSDGADKEQIAQQYKNKWIDDVQETDTFANRAFFLMQYLIYAMFPDSFERDHWTEELHKTYRQKAGTKVSDFISYFLYTASEIFQMAVQIRVSQGFPMSYWDDHDKIYPKLVLIKDILFKEKRSIDVKELDYQQLSEAMGLAAYIVIVNGESAERKMIFVIYPGDNIVFIDKIDPRNGVSQFILSEEYVDSRLETVLRSYGLHCRPRSNIEACDQIWNDTSIPEAHKCMYCKTRQICGSNMLNIIATVISCLQDYLTRVNIDNSQHPIIDQPATGTNKTMIKPYMPDDMVQIFDISASKNHKVKKRFKLYTEEHIGVEKCPHTRRGTYRYNPKTGKRDIKVRGSIIHKDKYQGFATGGRLIE